MKVNSYIKKVITIFALRARKSLARVDNHRIYFEGGLGSQILAMVDYLESKKKVDLSYFDDLTVGTNENGLSIWPWKLNRYGYQMEELREDHAPKRGKFHKLLYLKNSETTAINLNYEDIWDNFRNYRTAFPIDMIALSEFLTTNTQRRNNHDYAAIHIRRGDYIRVASHLVSLKLYLDRRCCRFS